MRSDSIAIDVLFLILFVPYQQSNLIFGRYINEYFFWPLSALVAILLGGDPVDRPPNLKMNQLASRDEVKDVVVSLEQVEDALISVLLHTQLRFRVWG